MTTYHLRKLIRPLPGMVIQDIPIPEPAIKSGFGARKEVGKTCRERGYSKVLLVTDTTLKSLGYDEKVVASLEEEGIGYKVFSEISSEPTVDILDAGRKAALEFEADCIIGLGGGSVMDACKMIAAGCRLKHLETHILLQKFLLVPGKTIPIINIPSTAGTGAEMTVGAIITDKAKNRKSSTVVVGLDVTDVILDSELTVKMPRSVTAACGIDALSHGLEGVAAPVKSSKEDFLKSLECIRLVLENLPIVLDNPGDIEARQQMCLAANYGGNAINRQLAGYVHAFAHSVGAKYHIPHGNAIAMCLLPVMEVEKAYCTEHLAEAAFHCKLAVEGADGTEDAAGKLLQAISDLMDKCNFARREHIPESDIDELLHLINLDSINYTAPLTMTDEEVKNILRKL